MPADVGQLAAVTARGAHNAQVLNQPAEGSALDVWRHTWEGASTSNLPANSIRDGDIGLSRGLAQSFHRNSLGDVGQGLSGQATNVAREAMALVGMGEPAAPGEAPSGVLAKVGGAFALLTSLEQLVSAPFGLIPFPAFPALRITDMDVGLPHIHMHPPNLIPPAPPVPLPSTGPVIPIPILSGATKTLINGMPAARCGDIGLGIWCGGFFPLYEVFLGSANVWIEGSRAGRLLVDITKHCIFSSPRPSDPPTGPMFGMTISGSPNVLIGGVPLPSLSAIAISKGLGLVFKGVGRVAKAIAARVGRGMKPGFIKCVLLRAEPVHVLTGEVVVEQQDFALPWRVPVTWTRRYGSQQTRHGTCGRGWETPADARLEFEDDGGVTFRDGSPGASVFAKLPEPGAPPERELVAGATIDRTRDAQGIEWLVVRVKGGLRYFFPSPAFGERGTMVARVVDGCENWVEYMRDANGLTEIRDNAGQRIVVRSVKGRIERMELVDPANGAMLPLIRYEYTVTEDLGVVYDALDAPYRFAYDGVGRLIRHTDRVGLSFHYEYDSPMQDARCIHAFGDGGLYDYHLRYEPAIGSTWITDSLGHTSLVECDEKGLPVRETDPLGGVITWEYDAAGRCVLQVDASGARWGWEYDAWGNVVHEVAPDGAVIEREFDISGHVLATVDPNGGRWAEEWDALGLLRSRVSPRGAVWTYDYDSRGDLVEMRDPLGHPTRILCDAFGVVREVVDPLGGATQFSRDPQGNVTQLVDPAGHATTYMYDAKARVVRRRDATGGSVVCRYDAEDRVISIRDAEGRTTRFKYVGLGELAERINADGTRVRYQYDTEERVIAFVNERNQQYTITRDPLGRVVRSIDYWGGSTELSYRGSGALDYAADALGRTTHYAFNAAGRVVSAAYFDGSVDTWEYDRAGDLVGAVNDSARIARVYDADGNLLEERQNDFVVTNTYDLAGHRISRRSTAGHELRFSYDARGLAIGVELDSAPLVRTRRDARGLPLSESLGRNASRAFKWDAMGRSVARRVTVRSVVVADRQYQYGPTGLLSMRQDTPAGAEQLLYDPMGRLTEQIDAAGDRTRFEYDAAGDLLVNAGPAADSDGPVPLRRMRWRDSTYEFDSVGNLVRRVRRAGTACFTWNGVNRLSEAVNERGEIVRFRYDALGRRIAKTVGERETLFRWDGDLLLADEVEAGHPREFVHRPGSFELLASVNGQVCYYNGDPVGLPREVVDNSGRVVWSARYDALGKPVSVAANGYDNPMRFQGQYHDDETGLSYNRFRYFEPELASFISADPLGLSAGSNTYAYAPNVWSWIDPYGLTCTQIALGKDPHFKRLADQLNSTFPIVATWRNWLKEGITRRTVDRHFGRAFHQAADRATHIHFALDGIDDVSDAVRRGAAGFNPRTHNMTNAELHHIASNPDLLSKTTFYRNGQPVPTPAFGL